MKQSSRIFGRIGSLAIPLVALVAAYGLDRWHRGLAQAAAQDFDFVPALWGGLLANLIFGIVMIGAAWMMLVRRRSDRLVAAVYLVVGALVALYPLSILLPDPASLPLFGAAFAQPVHFALLDFGIGSRVALAAILLTILGVVGFTKPQRRFGQST